jgi:hypothetical protein
MRCLNEFFDSDADSLGGQFAMIAPKPHPVVVAYDSLLALRQYAATNPNDGAARFATFCAANLAHSHAQLFQDLFVAFALHGKTKWLLR